ncbi:Hypothetical protein GbCGDNIH3_7144 [Granulibacter bethesdensis]|uniref:Uncharacterized protein n=1 Tax=Granulibacter bethesdensis TaxID=364410 RepID=A0AAN0RCU0_9PROT|nr:Tc toxin subunit A [Granulibacter bethesdensis]AHJ62553.1 Hypothetical protein GbCGDNIH3_7144 [Granulibacter bethesdensis]
MSQSTSPVLSSAARTYGLQDKLVELGYTSVFDIASIPKERFIGLVGALLGDKAAPFYDLVVGYAHQVTHRFHRRSGAGDVLEQNVQSAAPTYADLFFEAGSGWRNMAPAGALEANDGPAAYLVHLYQLALLQEGDAADDDPNRLASRRPDLEMLPIDDASVHEVLPQIQLVNEILEAGIKKNKNLDDDGAVDRLLSVTRYPNRLPYDHGRQQIHAAQRALDVSVQDVVLGLEANLMRWFFAPAVEAKEDNVSTRVTSAKVLARLQMMGCQLGREQQLIIVEQPHSSGESLAEFYSSNYGDSTLQASSFARASVLQQRTGLTLSQLEALLCKSIGAFTVKMSPNLSTKPDDFGDGTFPPQAHHCPLYYGARFINGGAEEALTLGEGDDGHPALSGLSDDRLDRINRMVRLQGWLGISFEELDLLVTATMAAEGESNHALRMNDKTLRMLGVFHHFQQQYGIFPRQFAAWLHQVPAYSIVPEKSMLDQVFNGGADSDAPLIVDGTDFHYALSTGSDGIRSHRIAKVLGLSQRQFHILASRIAERHGSVSLCTLPCTLDVLSAFYRIATLGRALGMIPEDFCWLVDQLDGNTGAVWNQLTGKPVIADLRGDTLLADDFLSLLSALSVVTIWQRQHGLSISTLKLLLTATTQLRTSGNFSFDAAPGHVHHQSAGWKDAAYNAETGELTLIQQIAFRVQDVVSEFHLPLPSGFTLNGAITWDNQAPEGISIADDYPGSRDQPFTWEGKDTTTPWAPVQFEHTAVLNIPLKGEVKDPTAFAGATSYFRVHTYNYDVKSHIDLSMLFGRGEPPAMSAGSDEQFAFLQQVWEHTERAVVDAASLAHTGIIQVDEDGASISWQKLLEEAGLLDGNGLVVMDDPITDAVKTMVAEQKIAKADQDRTSSALANALSQARQLQQGSVLGLLAHALGVSLSHAPLLLQWMGCTTYSWLEGICRLRKNTPAAQAIPVAHFEAMRELARRALLCRHFSLSSAMLQQLMTSPTSFGFGDDVTAPIGLWEVYLLSRYGALLERIGAAGHGKESDILAYLREAAAESPPSPAAAANSLSPLLGWERDEILAAWSVLGGVAHTLPQIDVLLRMQQGQALTGLGVMQQHQAFQLGPTSSYEEWQGLGQAMVAGASFVRGTGVMAALPSAT